MRRLVSIWIFIFIFLAAVIYLPGISKYLSLKRKERQLDKEIQSLREQIKELKREEYLIKNNMLRLEEVVREELGLVKPGEVIYRILEEPAKKDE